MPELQNQLFITLPEKKKNSIKLGSSGSERQRTVISKNVTDEKRFNNNK